MHLHCTREERRKKKNKIIRNALQYDQVNFVVDQGTGLLHLRFKQFCK